MTYQNVFFASHMKQGPCSKEAFGFSCWLSLELITLSSPFVIEGETGTWVSSSHFNAQLLFLFFSYSVESLAGGQ